MKIEKNLENGCLTLKVEGRQKDASYVYGVGRIYRRLLDERRSASADEIEELAALFERGFTDGPPCRGCWYEKSCGGGCRRLRQSMYVEDGVCCYAQLLDRLLVPLLDFAREYLSARS